MKISHDIKSSNYSEPKKERKIEYIILHYTEQDFETSVESLTSKAKGVSAHYLIAEDGEIFNLVPDEFVAWHAGTGKSSWHGRDFINTFSIGIEIVNLGDRPFPDIQMVSVIELCHYLKKKYNIPRENFIGHSDIAPDRKLDPGIFFDWKRLSDEGVGIDIPIIHNKANCYPKGSGFNRQDLACAKEEPNRTSQIQSQNPDALPAMLKVTNIRTIQTHLSKIGYKIETTGKLDKQTSNVIRAFQSHFCPESIFKSHGIEKYRDFDSKYRWDEKANEILNYIVKKS